MGIFERDNLPAVANIEQVSAMRLLIVLCAKRQQCCATGLTAEGKTPKTLIEEMVPILDSRDVMYVLTAVLPFICHLVQIAILTHYPKQPQQSAHNRPLHPVPRRRARGGPASAVPACAVVAGRDRRDQGD